MDTSSDDKKAAIAVVLAHELAVQSYDFDKVDSLHTPDARVIEESYPHPFEPDDVAAGNSTRRLVSTSSIIPGMQWPTYEAMLHGSP